MQLNSTLVTIVVAVVGSGAEKGGKEMLSKFRRDCEG